MAQISVVIPFFQRERGILRRALQSVLEQKSAISIMNVEIIIVDDESPVDPRGEISSLNVPQNFNIRIVARSNGGPGMARNTGFDAVSNGAEAIALLDSDDIWDQYHLDRAVNALNAGAEFYFSNFLSFGTSIPYFTEKRLLLSEFLSNIANSNAGFIDEYARNGYASITGKEACHLLLKQYFAHTSSIVFRPALVKNVRYAEGLRYAGEDYLFSLSLALTAQKVTFSRAIGMTRGTGINIYESSVSWAHPNNINIIIDNLLCFKIFSRLASTDTFLHKTSVRKTNVYRHEFVHVWIRQLIFQARWNMKPLKKMLSHDPVIIFKFPKFFMLSCVRVLLGREVIRK